MPDAPRIAWLETETVNATLIRFAPWVASKGRRPPRGVDPDDSESMAWAAVWRAAVKCERPGAVRAYAERAYRWLVLDHVKRRSVLPTITGVDWHRVSADSVRFPPDAESEAAPCIDCETRGGYVRPGGKAPTRVKGRCGKCRMNHRNVERKEAA